MRRSVTAAPSPTAIVAGYSNVAPITIAAANVVLDAGTGTASYVQIGNGGFKSGAGLTGGTATNGGDIMITSAHAVTLVANGADAYAQIGNGGDQSNLNPAASAGGVDSGNIVVHAPSGAAGAVTLTAGSGANAYAQIGNGGYSANAGVNAMAANFTMLGSVTVTDLSLAGGNTVAIPMRRSAMAMQRLQVMAMSAAISPSRRTVPSPTPTAPPRIRQP